MRHSRTWLWLAVLGVLCAALATVPVSARGANSNGDLCLYGSDVTTDTGIQMLSGTDPSIAQVPGGTAEVAFQDASGQLATYLDGPGTESATAYGVAAGTSPAITTSSSSVFVAMTAAGSDELWIGDGSSMSGTGQVVGAGTSPAVTAFDATSAEYVFNDTNGTLADGDGTNWTEQQFGAQLGTSPSVTEVGGVWEAADQANTSALWVHADGSGANSEDGMNPSSSPSISQLGTSGDYEVAFEANTNVLWTIAAQAGDTGIDGNSTGEAMAPGTNPSVAAIGSGTGYEIAYQGANGHLWIYGSDGSMDTGQAMAPGTSPSIAQTAAGYEIAYQCAPPAQPTTSTVVVTTTTAQATTPSPSPSPTPTPVHSNVPRVQAQFSLDLDWNGTRTHLVRITSLKRLPRTAVVRFACRAETAGDPCPRLGRLAKRKRTIAKELAVVAGRTFTKNNLLTVTVSARHYVTEVFQIHLTGRRPRITRRWK